MVILRKKWALSIVTKVVVALFAAIFCWSFALIPRLGYSVETKVYLPITKFSQYGFAVVDFNCNAYFNPLLYPMSWLFGRGHLSGNYSMLYLPQGYSAGGTTKWGKPEEIENSATMRVVMDEFYYNVPILPALFFAVELINKRRLYVWFLGGVIGFIVAVPVGVLFGLLFGVFSTYFVLPRLKKNFLGKSQSLENSE